MSYIPRRDFDKGGRGPPGGGGGGDDGGYDVFMKAKGRRKSSMCAQGTRFPYGC